MFVLTNVGTSKMKSQILHYEQSVPKIILLLEIKNNNFGNYSHFVLPLHKFTPLPSWSLFYNFYVVENFNIIILNNLYIIITASCITRVIHNFLWNHLNAGEYSSVGISDISGKKKIEINVF